MDAIRTGQHRVLVQFLMRGRKLEILGFIPRNFSLNLS